MPTPRQREKSSMFTRDELILERLKDLKEGQREFNERMDRFENELRNVTRHSQIMTASVVGIALAVIYFVFTH